MTSRSDLDMPATVLAAVVGVAIILLALPFTIAAFPQTPKSYDASWGERTLDAKSLTVPTDSTTYTTSVTASDFQPASVKVELNVCSDPYDARLQQQAATLHVKLTQKRGSATTVLADVPPFPCSQKEKGTFTVKLGDHADVAGAQASNPETAKRIVWLDASALNVTGPSTYTLEVTPSRAASTIPAIPTVAPAPTLAASLHLAVNGWDVAMNEHQKEVGK